MAAQPVDYWLFLISTDHIQKFGATKEQFEQAIRAVLAEQEKRAREAKADDRYERQRTEKKQERDDARARRDEERARKEAERIEREQEARRKKREAAFAEIAELPQLTHEARLKDTPPS